MKRTIYKFPIKQEAIVDGVFSVSIKVGFECRLIEVARDTGGELCAWYIVYPDKPVPTILEKLWLIGTGRDIPGGQKVPYLIKYFKTLHEAPYVWHVFQS